MRPDRTIDREITPESQYRDRRDWLRQMAIAAGTVAFSGWAYRRFNRSGGMAFDSDPIAAFRPVGPDGLATGFDTSDDRTAVDRVINYNNFYEFTTDKEMVSSVARGFVAKPWTVKVDGLCRKPGDIDFEQILKIAPLEERVYRMRCVEGWSMVVPWVGLSLRSLLAHVDPTADAKYVAFETLNDPTRFPNQKGGVLTWPYVEGLRLDEAMHPLTILAVGLYGKMLPAQNGAPLRLIVPWKYGFKGIKSIVRISLTDRPPPCTWNREAPGEYGFFANVNPEVPHPRWSQASEARLGESGRRPTLPFNGYADQVASLYAGLDLRTNF